MTSTDKPTKPTMTTAQVVEYLRAQGFRTQRGTFASPEWVRLRVHKHMFPPRTQDGGWLQQDVDAWLAARKTIEGHLLTTRQVSEAIVRLGCKRLYARSAIIKRLREVSTPIEDGGRLLWPRSAPEAYLRQFGPPLGKSREH